MLTLGKKKGVSACATHALFNGPALERIEKSVMEHVIVRYFFFFKKPTCGVDLSEMRDNAIIRKMGYIVCVCVCVCVCMFVCFCVCVCVSVCAFVLCVCAWRRGVSFVYLHDMTYLCEKWLVDMFDRNYLYVWADLFIWVENMSMYMFITYMLMYSYAYI